MKLCFFIVRDKISLGRPVTDNDLKALDCYYESSTFNWDHSSKSLHNILDNLEPHISHLIDPNIDLIILE